MIVDNSTDTDGRLGTTTWLGEVTALFQSNDGHSVVVLCHGNILMPPRLCPLSGTVPVDVALNGLHVRHDSCTTDRERR